MFCLTKINLKFKTFNSFPARQRRSLSCLKLKNFECIDSQKVLINNVNDIDKKYKGVEENEE